MFPPGIIGIHFKGCNLDNVIIPFGNTTEGCCQRQTAWQNDGEAWTVDDELKPIEPRSKKEYQRLGISVDPKDIPVDFVRIERVEKTKWEAEKDSQEVLDWFIETPIVVSEQIIPQTDKEPVTYCNIEGKGRYFINGRKPRKCQNKPATAVAMDVKEQADIDALKALDLDLAERLGY